METLHKKSLFGDVDTALLSPESDWFFIIERILEFGDIDDLKWMKKTLRQNRSKQRKEQGSHTVSF
jgi:hypothetical protein